MSADAERHVLASERRQLGDAQARLDGNQEERAISPSDPGGVVRAVQNCLDFLVVKERHDAALESFARDSEDALAEERMRRIREGDVSEEGMERRESCVAAASGIAAVLLEMVEELAEEGGVEIGDREAGGGATETLGREAQKQTESVAIGCHRVWARAPLLEQAGGKEGLQKRGEILSAHGASLRDPVARSVASRSNSGTASMYQ